VTFLALWRALPYRSALGLVAAFIMACGAGRLLIAISLWAPLYLLKSAVDAATAFLFVVAAIVIVPVIRQLLGDDRKLRASLLAAGAAQRGLEELATTDSLTRLANRRRFDESLETEIKRAKRTGTSVALIMIDVDKFKPFNDTFGHQSGDACLRFVAEVILAQLRRAGDLGARFGGDEFAAILPDADVAGATLIAERIVQATRGMAILHPANGGGFATASAGVAAITPSLNDLGPHDLLRQADTALYAAKERGGDQVCSADQALHEQSEALDRPEVGHSIAVAKPHAHGAARMPIGMDFVSILRSFPFGVLVTDSTRTDNPIVFANAGFAAMTGYSARETVGRNARFLQGAETDPRTVAELANAIQHGRPIQRELLNYRKDGRAFWCDLYMQPLFDKQGALVGYVGLEIDQTARHNAELAQREGEARLAGIVQNFPGYIFQRARKANGIVGYSYFSESYWRMLGIDEIPELDDLDPYEHIYRGDVESVRAAVARSQANLSPCVTEFRALCANGTLLWLRTQSAPRVLADGSVVWDGVGIDISAEMASKEELAYLAYHDPLTGLCNRVLFIKTLDEMCASALLEPRSIAAFKVDLDEFQKVNDARGLSIGDAVLRCVAERLTEFAGASGTSARLGGDEFGVVIADVPPEVSIADKAADLCRLLQRPMQIPGREISIQVCVGAAAYPFGDHDPMGEEDVAVELVKRSNFALADAKRGGSGSFRQYSKALDDRERNRSELRRSMQRALEEHQFILHYHPMVDLASGEIVGAEALLRWAHPELGMQRPDLFIPEAESSGLIAPLGAWVIRTALFEMQEWQKRCARPLHMAINVSGVQLLDPNFVSMLDGVLEETGVDPRLIDLELTESALIDAPALSVLQVLKARGCQLVVDDFGTGYSSFRYLRTLPISAVKIDQAFVRNMVIDSSDASIVRAIVAVAKSLGLRVIAEGIETWAQRDFLGEEGCCVGQGYLFSLPLTSEDFCWLLTSNAKLPLGEEHEPLPTSEKGEAHVQPNLPKANRQLAEEMK
jgi:diguanylate cyclase (GGDEF)-like protein/PAS domain S-box-containing protein